MNHRKCAFLLILIPLCLASCQSTSNEPSTLPQGVEAKTSLPDLIPESMPVDMAPAGSKPVAFQRVILTMESGSTMGNVTGGWLHIHVTTLKANPGEGSKRFVFIGNEELRKAHYTIPGGDNQLFGEDASAKARYQIGGEIPNIRLDVHMQPGWTTSKMEAKGDITIDWQVYDTLLQKVVFKKTVITPFRQVSSGDEGDALLTAMFRHNLRSLLAASDFVEFMRPGSKAAETSATGESGAPLTISIGAKPETVELPGGFSTALDSFVTVEPGTGLASGFIVSSDGYVLTAAHVVSGVSVVPVRLRGGMVFEAKVVRINENADVALLKLPGASFHPLGLVEKDVTDLGVDVYAVGNPAAKELNASISRGVVSGIREIEGRKFLQTDAAANPGSSGGPLLDKNGRVVGVISWKVTGQEFQGLAFAVPAREALARLNVTLQ